MTTCWATPTSQQETCWITSLRLTGTSLCSTWRSTLNTCTELEIPNIQLNPCSSKLKIVPTILNQGASSLDTRNKSTLGMQKYATGHFMSACRRWNKKLTVEKTWTQLKSQFAAAHRQHKQMQVESAATAGYHYAMPPLLRMNIRLPNPPLDQ
jgi:hypothetical protein